MQSQETCQNAIAVLHARERCSGRPGIPNLKKIPSLPVHFRVAGGDGILVSTASQLESFTKQLDEQKIAVYVTNPKNLDEIFLSIERLGELFATSETAKKLATGLRNRTQTVAAAVASAKPVRVFYQVSDQ